MNKLLPIVLFGASMTSPAWAIDEYPPIDFSLSFTNHKLELDYAGSAIRTKVKHVSLSWSERYWDRLQIGFIAGSSRLTQSNNSVTAGRNLDGYHAGLMLDVELYATPTFQLYAGATYLHEDVKEKTDTDTIQISWDEPSAHVGAAIDFGVVRLHAAARRAKIDGEQQQRGSINQTDLFEQDAKTGAVLGVTVTLEDEGYVKFVGETGHRDGVAVYFGKQY